MSRTLSLAPTPQVPAPIPPLKHGDRLSRDEFERRYEAMPEVKKAELIEGVVYMPSPVRLDVHGEQHLDLGGWASVYRINTPGIRGGTDSTVRLDLSNEPQPDVCLFLGRGGIAHVDAKGYIAGAPEFAAEVAASSVGLDLGDKRTAYARNGIREYLVWRVLDQAIDWFILRDGRYESLLPGADGITRSEVFPGLWLDAAALVRGDLVRVHDVLHQGLADPTHAAFVARLATVGA